MGGKLTEIEAAWNGFLKKIPEKFLAKFWILKTKILSTDSPGQAHARLTSFPGKPPRQSRQRQKSKIVIELQPFVDSHSLVPSGIIPFVYPLDPLQAAARLLAIHRHLLHTQARARFLAIAGKEGRLPGR